MAITAAPFALKNLGLDAEPLRQAVASLVPNAGGLLQAGDLNVTQTVVASLGVLVGIGRAWLPGNDTANLAGQAYSTQGQYFAINDAPFTVTLATANATNPRIDLIYIGVLDAQYNGASNLIKIDKVTGTPAASPVVPTLPKNAIALAQVAVAANATNVTNANVTQLAKIPYNAKYAEYYSNGFPVAGGQVNWDCGPFTLDASKSYNNSFANVTGALSGAVNITETGLYTVSCCTAPQTNPGNSGMLLKNGAMAFTSSFTNGVVWEMSGSFTRWIAAGSYVRGVLVQTNGTTNSTIMSIYKHPAIL